MDFDLAVTIRRSPATVWALLDDVQDHVHRPGSPVAEMEKMPPGPVRVGTRWREIVRLAPFLAMTVTSEVTAVETGRRLEERFNGPWMSGRIVYEIEPIEGGSRLRQHETWTPHGPLRLAGGIMGRMLSVRLTARLAAIREVLEADLRS